MDFSTKFRRGIWSAVLILLLASPLSAQIEDHLSAYTGRNAEGYLDPLVSAMGTCLNGGLFRSGDIHCSGLLRFGARQRRSGAGGTAEIDE